MLIYIIINLILISQTTNKQILKFVFQIHRHGARAPLKLEKGIDCYGEKWISENELTEVGKRSHYLIGIRNRRRFIKNYKFLKKKFDPEEVQIYTTDYNRTIQSVYAQLHGLYPFKTGKSIPNNLINTNLIRPHSLNYSDFYRKKEKEFFYNESINYSLPFQMNVFPFHFFYLPNHHVQLQSRKNCPNLKKMRKQVEKREDMINFINKLNNKYGKILMKLENTTNSSFLFNYKTLYKYMDTFIADITDGRNLTLFKKLIGKDNIEDYKKLCFEFLFLDWNGTNYFNVKIAQVTMSYTFKKILNKMDDVIYNKSKLKYLIYSMHDNSIGGFEIFNQLAFNTSLQYTYFSGNSYYELFEDNNQLYVRLISNDEERFSIPYTLFKEKVQKLLLTEDEIYEFCGWEKNKIENYTQILRLIILIINTFLFLLFIVNFVRYMK